MTWSAHVKVALDDFTLDVAVEAGDRPLAIIGPNGSGKTTLLRVIAGAVEPDGGEIVVDGVPLFSAARGINLAPQHRSIGYVPQGYGLFPHLSVLENVLFGLSGEDAPKRARAMLVEVEAAAHVERRPTSLSGGEQQRVALARALVTDPRLLLLDEPLAALDVQSRREIRRLLAKTLRARRATAVVTHDVRDVVALDADVCVMENGRVIQRGTVDELTSAPANAFVEEFVGIK